MQEQEFLLNHSVHKKECGAVLRRGLSYSALQYSGAADYRPVTSQRRIAGKRSVHHIAETE
jgi:hypothetical protein